MITLMFICLMLLIPIPVVPAILWLEINVYGRTYLPESLCVVQVLLYLYWRYIWWKLMSKTKIPLEGRECM